MDSSATHNFPDFGSEICKEQYPHHQSNFTRLNHGSFGSAPDFVLNRLRCYQGMWLANPDAFWLNDLKPLTDRGRCTVAEELGCSDSKVALVDNATQGICTVLQYFTQLMHEGRWPSGAAVVMTSTTYNAVKHAIRAYTGSFGAQIVTIDLPFPLATTAGDASSSCDVIVAAFETGIQAISSQLAGKRIALAVIDHIVSTTAIVVPVKRVIAVLRKHGVEHVMVDGAHAPGSIPLDIPSLGADYYVGNIHKWMFAPAACAILYVDSTEALRRMHPLTVSHNWGQGLVGECSMLGTKDYASHCIVHDAVLYFRIRNGGSSREGRNTLFTYLHNLCKQAAQFLADGWGTRVFSHDDSSGSMRMVQLPQVHSTLKLLQHCASI